MLYIRHSHFLLLQNKRRSAASEGDSFHSDTFFFIYMVCIYSLYSFRFLFSEFSADVQVKKHFLSHRRKRHRNIFSEVVHGTDDITWPYMEALHSSPPHPHPTEKHLTPSSIMYFVIITDWGGGERSTKSQKNSSDFKPNQPLMKHWGLFPRLPLNCSGFLQTGGGVYAGVSKGLQPPRITSHHLVFPSTWRRRSSQHSWHRSRYGGN